jgi:restriction system protein
VKLKMHENSLFSILLRSPWWASGLLAVAVGAGLRFFLPLEFAVFAAVPFAAICLYVGWRQLRVPSAARTAAGLERLRAMPWEEFARALEEAWRRQGYAVKALGAPQADFELARDARTTLVACKRWKATRTGIEPLRELEEAGRARGAHECLYVAAGEITEQARELAARKRIRLMEGAELVSLLKN